LGVLKVPTVRGRKVDGQATVIADAFGAVALLFFLGELTICPDTRVGATGRGCIR